MPPSPPASSAIGRWKGCTTDGTSLIPLSWLGVSAPNLLLRIIHCTVITIRTQGCASLTFKPRSTSDTCETTPFVAGTGCTSTLRRFLGSWKLLILASASFGFSTEHEVDKLRQSGRSGARLPAVIPRLASMFDQMATWLVASEARLEHSLSVSRPKGTYAGFRRFSATPGMGSGR
jgi:hypothetical protein